MNEQDANQLAAELAGVLERNAPHLQAGLRHAGDDYFVCVRKKPTEKNPNQLEIPTLMTTPTKLEEV